MEKVKVVKSIPGILNVGDVLVSPVAGADFTLEETKITKEGSSERYASLDYVTVSENIPEFFEFDIEIDEEDDFEDIELECGDMYEEEGELKSYSCGRGNWRSVEEVDERYEFFAKKYFNAEVGSEEQVVYKNLMWFIEWLQGDIELL